ncbi:MAG: hypothetical protein AAGI12_15320 [Pseudomonadota bacterium]
MTETIKERLIKLADLGETDAEALFQAEADLDAIADKARKIAAEAGDDVSTKTGQDAIRSTAAALGSLKQALDKKGKEAKDSYQRKVTAIDAGRSRLKGRLQLAQDTVRKPLTDLEEAERKRAEEQIAIFHEMEDMANIPLGSGLDLIDQREARLAELRGINDWGDRGEEASSLLAALKTIFEKGRGEIQQQLDQAEELRQAKVREAEQQRLRDERAEKDRQELEQLRSEKLEADRQAKQALEAQEAAEAEAQRQKQAALEIARQAEEAEARRAKEYEEAERRRNQEIAEAEARHIAEEKAAAEQAEKQRLEAEQQAEKLRTVAQSEVVTDIIGLDSQDAEGVAAAIVAGDIRHVRFEVAA